MVFPKFVENVHRKMLVSWDFDGILWENPQVNPLPPRERVRPAFQDRADFSGDTALRTAAARGHEETVQCLVAKRADLTLGDVGGWKSRQADVANYDG